jgi:predicted ATPase
LLRDSPALRTVSEARVYFAEALKISKQQGARWRQLRAALSMHRLEMQCGRADRAQLAEIYSSFTEGHETADLKEAKALLGVVPSRSTV